MNLQARVDELPGMLNARLGSDGDLSWLIQDLCMLAAHYSRISGHRCLNLDLAPVEKQECPFFHVDNRDLRLLCTYLGQGTEFLDDGQADRRWLGQGRHERVMRTSHSHQAHPMEILLMKGSAYPGQPDRGLIHRSPPVKPGQGPRLRLRLDPTE